LDKQLSDFWRGNARFQDIFIDEFIRDALYLEITGIVTGQKTVYELLLMIINSSNLRFFRRVRMRTRKRERFMVGFRITLSRMKFIF
jgi:hypothetical protein